MQINLNKISECFWLGIQSKAGDNRWVSFQGMDFLLQVRGNWKIIELKDPQTELKLKNQGSPRLKSSFEDVSLKI